MKTVDYLKAAKKALGITSDYALAKYLGISSAAMSLLANGHTAMGATTAAKVAVLLKRDPLKVMADAELERGSTDVFWKRIRDAAVWAVFAIGCASFGVVPGPAHAGFNNNFFAEVTAITRPGPGRYMHCMRFLRRALAWLKGWL